MTDYPATATPPSLMISPHSELALEAAIAASSSGMQVKVKTGRAFIRGQLYESTSSPATTLPIAANSSGNPRSTFVTLTED